jgi:hypothetical protein
MKRYGISKLPIRLYPIIQRPVHLGYINILKEFIQWVIIMVRFYENEFVSFIIHEELHEKITLEGMEKVHLDVFTCRDCDEVGARRECEFTL